LQIRDKAADDHPVRIASTDCESAIAHRSRKLVVVGIQPRIDGVAQLIGGVDFYRDAHRRVVSHGGEFTVLEP
jgi:hypothetical protein